jgi:hypothetical protein
VLAFGLTMILLATPDASPSARLLTGDGLLSDADVEALDREARVLNGHIMELRPRVPTGFVVGMALGFSFAVLLLPGIPLLVIGATGSVFGSGALLAVGGMLTVLGGSALLVALICAVLGNNAEGDMADERARLIERRDAIKKRLEPYQPPQRGPPTPVPGYVPGVQLDVPAPRLVTVAHF